MIYNDFWLRWSDLEHAVEALGTRPVVPTYICMLYASLENLMINHGKPMFDSEATGELFPMTLEQAKTFIQDVFKTRLIDYNPDFVVDGVKTHVFLVDLAGKDAYIRLLPIGVGRDE